MDNDADSPAADLRALDALFAQALFRADCPPTDDHGQPMLEVGQQDGVHTTNLSHER